MDRNNGRYSNEIERLAMINKTFTPSIVFGISKTKNYYFPILSIIFLENFLRVQLTNDTYKPIGNLVVEKSNLE